MHRLFAPRGRALALAVALGLGAPAGAALAAPAGGTGALPPEGAPRTLTARDVALSNEKARLAFADLVAMWTDDFARIGQRFTAPGLAGYRGAVRSACGVMRPGNAGYCPSENAIYFDELFLAGQAKRTALQLGTDGDMAAVGIIAHEMGHAVAIQLGHASRFTYENESVADCLTGAFARRAGHNGSLEAGDVDEAFYAMSAAGDPEPELTGDPRFDRRIRARAALMGHGTQEQRMQNFRQGLDGGPQACLAELE
jgi:predicted metalloprotease